MYHKAPIIKELIMNGKEAHRIRTTRNENQTTFWKRVGITQSGGCRYEHGRSMPTAVSYLLQLIYLPESQSTKLLHKLRK